MLIEHIQVAWIGPENNKTQPSKNIDHTQCEHKIQASNRSWNIIDKKKKKKEWQKEWIHGTVTETNNNNDYLLDLILNIDFPWITKKTKTADDGSSFNQV